MSFQYAIWIAALPLRQAQGEVARNDDGGHRPRVKPEHDAKANGATQTKPLIIARSVSDEAIHVLSIRNLDCRVPSFDKLRVRFDRLGGKGRMTRSAFIAAPRTSPDLIRGLVQFRQKRPGDHFPGHLFGL